METNSETTIRQDFVDKLSASAGVSALTVQARQMAGVPYLVDSSEVREQLRALSVLLFKSS